MIDFGDLKWVRGWLDKHFDHTLVLNLDDPLLDFLKSTLAPAHLTDPNDIDVVALAKFILVPNCGAEGLAKFIFTEIDRPLRAMTNDRVYLMKVEAMEDEKNSATYYGENGECDHG